MLTDAHEFQKALEAEVEEERRQAEHQLKLFLRGNEAEMQEVKLACAVKSMLTPSMKMHDLGLGLLSTRAFMGSKGQGSEHGEVATKAHFSYFSPLLRT